MHPILAGKGRVALYLAAWVPIGSLLAGLLGFSEAFSWPEAFAFSIPLAVFYAFVCLGAYHLCRSVPLGSTSPVRLAITHLAAASISASLWVLVGRLWVELLSGLQAPTGRLFAFPADSYTRAAPVVLGVGVLLFLLAIAFQYVILAIEASREAETQALKFQLLSRDAELKALRSQIHPHFLFNALNSISSLTTSRPEEARRMCLLLGDFLRRSLTLGVKERIPLAEEVALAESYLAIEKVRFGSRLEQDHAVEEAVASCLVPPLVLQPLVENAVTHGIAGMLEGGTVRITARLSGSRLAVAIDNPRDPDSPGRQGAGVGLENVRRRLAAVFGREAEVQTRKEAASFRVELRLPAEAQDL